MPRISNAFSQRNIRRNFKECVKRLRINSYKLINKIIFIYYKMPNTTNNKLMNRRDAVENNVMCILKLFPEMKVKVENIMKYYDDFHNEIDSMAKLLMENCRDDNEGGKTRNNVGTAMKGGGYWEELFLAAAFVGITGSLGWLDWDNHWNPIAVGAVVAVANQAGRCCGRGGGGGVGKDRKSGKRDAVKNKVMCILKLFPEMKGKIENIMKYYDDDYNKIYSKAKLLMKNCRADNEGGEKTRNKVGGETAVQNITLGLGIVLLFTHMTYEYIFNTPEDRVANLFGGGVGKYRKRKTGKRKSRKKRKSAKRKSRKKRKTRKRKTRKTHKA